MRCLQADLAIGDELVSWRHTAGLEELSQFVRRQKDRLVRIRDGLFPENMIRPRKMAGSISPLWARIDQERLRSGLRRCLGIGEQCPRRLVHARSNVAFINLGEICS